MAVFTLEIVTPDRLIYEGEAERLIVRGMTGDLCILAHHIDYATALDPGEASVVTASGERRAACTGGMLSVHDNHVRLMATTFEWEDEIDLNRAQRAKEAAEEQLKTMTADDKNYALVEAKLKRALARIRAKE
ncbi:MAG: ATP synthase F1 subunit epsilon [Clostridia bacterium]|nr:ATP synthase F1 subunit epsilon [Clostridia bacterium]